MIDPSDITFFGRALAEAGSAIGKLGDNIAHLVKLGTQGWDAAQARRTRNRLRDISARLALNLGQSMPLVSSLERYIAVWGSGGHDGGLEEFNRRWEDWHKIRYQVGNALQEIDSLIHDLSYERSSLVTQGIYLTLLKATGSRGGSLYFLDNMDAPQTPSEINALSATLESYIVLRENVGRAIDELNAYIGDSKSLAEDRPQQRQARVTSSKRGRPEKS